MLRLHRRHPSEPASEPTPERETGAWAGLPALPRAGVDVELTAPTQSFLRSLTGRREPPVSLAPLGHDVRLGAPSGIATGIARAVRASTATRRPLDLRPRPRPGPLQRLLRRAEAILAPPEADVSPSALEAPDQESAAPVEAAGDPEPEPQVAEAAETGAPGEARPVAPAAAGLVSVPERTESRAGAEAPTAGVARAAATSASGSAEAPLRVLRAADRPVEPARSLLVAPAELPAATQTAPARREVADEAPPAGELPIAGERPASLPPRPLRIVRRIGLGAPLRGDAAPSEPPAPAVQRAATPEAPAAAPTLRGDAAAPSAPEAPAAAPPPPPVEAAAPEVGHRAESADEQRPAMPLRLPVAPVDVQRSEAQDEPAAEPETTPASSQQQQQQPAEAPTAEVDAGPLSRPALPPARPVPGARTPPRQTVSRSVEQGAGKPAPPRGAPSSTDVVSAAPAAAAEPPELEAPLVGRPAPTTPKADATPRPELDIVPAARATQAEPPQLEAPLVGRPSPKAEATPRPELDIVPAARATQAEPPQLEAPLVGRPSPKAEATPRPELDVVPAAPAAEAEPPRAEAELRAERSRRLEAPLVGDSPVSRPVHTARALEPHPHAEAGPADVARQTAREETASPPTERLEAPGPASPAPVTPSARATIPVARAAPARRTAPLVAARPIVHLQRSPADSPTPEPARAGPEAPPPPRRLEAVPAAPAGAPVLQRSSPTADHVAAMLPPAVGPAPAVVARRATPVTPEPVTVARAPAEPSAAAAPLPEAHVEAPAPIQRAESAEAGPGAAASTSPQDLEEMAARLYDRIRSRLRDELLVDRERAGLVTDVR